MCLRSSTSYRRQSRSELEYHAYRSEGIVATICPQGIFGYPIEFEYMLWLAVALMSWLRASATDNTRSKSANSESLKHSGSSFPLDRLDR